ncbi:MAG: cytochrome ubiquinol oxidase subunit I, partial [Actinobacteria bacterium]|nr:cytochrome ubiquinol oxidase subunit I [Actinomycetota bacterium]
MLSMIIPTFARRRILGYVWVVASLVAIGFISFGVWVHHMFAVGAPDLTNSFFSVAGLIITFPSAVQIFAWTGTLWTGRPVWRTPLLFAIGSVVIFVLGGITGVMVSTVPFDWQATDSYFV